MVDNENYDDSLETTSKDNEDKDELSPEEEGFLKGYDEAYDEKSEDDDIDKEFE